MTRPALILLNYVIPSETEELSRFSNVYQALDNLIIAFKADRLPIISLKDPDLIPKNAQDTSLLYNELSTQYTDDSLSEILDHFISEHQIDEILLGGFNTEKSIANTIESCLKKYPTLKIQLIDEGHGSFLQDEKLAGMLKEGFNDYWNLLNVQHPDFSLQTSEQLIERF